MLGINSEKIIVEQLAPFQEFFRTDLIGAIRVIDFFFATFHITADTGQFHFLFGCSGFNKISYMDVFEVHTT